MITQHLKKLNESILPLIKTHLLKQRILYLYEMCNYCEVKEIKDNSVDSLKIKINLKFK